MTKEIKNKAVNLLKEYGIKNSFQRLKICCDLIKHGHCTIDDIHRRLEKEIPSLSKTTVYNTLNLFLEKELASQVITDSHEAIYEINQDDHAHFKCEVCGEVTDLKIDEKSLNVTLPDDYNVKQKHIFFLGTCNKCKNK